MTQFNLLIITNIYLASLLWSANPANTYTDHLEDFLARSAATVEHTVWDGNQISTWHGNHGDVVSYHVTGNSGLEWPKGSGNLAVFASGIWLASGRSKAPGGDWVEEIRTAAAEYTSEFVPGTLAGEDGYIYEIHRAELDAFLENDFATYSTMSAELPITEGSDRTTATVYFPTSDFEDWPADLGAPWVDADGDGLYNIENGDHPDILGDQFQWYAMNDGDAAIHTPLWGTTPMNVEIQTSMFGFNQSGALGNILFIRWVMTNKGNDNLDSVFVSMWHDDDLGNATDDLVGCDTTLSLGYTYNDTDGDGTYGIEAPAAGADFFQGPIVSSEADTASILTWTTEDGYHIKELIGFKTLPLTSFAKYINGSQIYADPETATEAYRYMNGLVGVSGEAYIDPTTNEPSVFVNDGDPVTNSGWIDEDPGDRRYLMTSGPFSFAPGDVQEVVGCIIIAGGSNWSKSITKLKYFDKFAQAAFDVNFDICSPPIPITAYSQLDERIVISFEEESEDVESYQCADYNFEGYNIYQGESPNGPWHRVATYDLVNGIKTILDFELDNVTGEILEFPSQFGSDSGLEHYFETTYDYVNNRDLINYRQYYYAVTTYAYDPDAAQRVIESTQEAITVIPMPPGLGFDLESHFGDNLEVTHTSGISDAQINIEVIDPYQLTGDQYKMYFTIDTRSNDNLWNLVNTTTYDTLYTNQDELSTESVTITDGFTVTFENATYNAPTGHSGAEQTVVGDSEPATGINYFATPGTWKGLMADFGLQSGTDEPSLLQLDVRFVFTEEPAIGYYLNYPNCILEEREVPFEIWTVEDSTRINVLAYVESGHELAFYDDYTLAENGDTLITLSLNNTTFAPIYEPYNETATFAAFSHTDCEAGFENIGWRLQFNKDESQFVYGDEFVVSFVNPLFIGVDEFTFIGEGLIPTSNINAQLDAINVFPNPYFGRNVEESNPLNRFVTFTHLGVGKNTIRVYNLSGDLVKKIEQTNIMENDPGNVVRWDLRNNAGVPVASGMYIAHIETVYGNKILKLAVMQPEERIDVY